MFEGSIRKLQISITCKYATFSLSLQSRALVGESMNREIISNHISAIRPIYNWIIAAMAEKKERKKRKQQRHELAT